jgi:hypothetical protein
LKPAAVQPAFLRLAITSLSAASSPSASIWSAFRRHHVPKPVDAEVRSPIAFEQYVGGFSLAAATLSSITSRA